MFLAKIEIGKQHNKTTIGKVLELLINEGIKKTTKPFE